MFIQKLKYNDFYGNNREDVFYFHMNLYDTVQFAVDTENKGSFIQQLIDEKDNKRILAMFEQIVRHSVGRRSDDGLTFEKNEKHTNRLMQSNAWDVLWTKIFQDPDFMANFINNVFPKGTDFGSEEFQTMVEEEKNRRLQGMETQNNEEN